MSCTISLAGQSLKLTSASDIEPYLKELRDNSTSVREFVLSGNTIGVEAAQALARVLKDCHALQTIDLSDIFTGRLISEIPQALKALCDSLIGLPALHLVDLSDNAFGGRSVEPMVAYLSSSYATLKTLRLSNNGMGPEGGSVIAKALIQSATTAKEKHQTPVLETVICGRNRLENGSAQDWATAFQLHAATLRQVRLYQNGIRMQGIAILAKGLASCSQLQVLDLQDNTATTLGSRAIAAIIPKWTLLEELNLSDCLLRSKGATRLLQVLSQGSNTKLAVLKMQSNEIDSKAVEELVKGVKAGNFPALRSIELNGNRVSEEDACVVELKEALGQDVLDELDDVEEVDPDEEESEEDEVESEEDDLVKADEKSESAEPSPTTKRDEKDSADLADLMSSVKLTQ